jgi:tripartite-type tricarboxylate transporter receptor subunit TctC
VAADKPAPGFPDVPLAKAAAPDYQVATWYGLWAPKGTPRDVVDKMAAEMRKALDSDELRPPGPAWAPRRPTSTATDFGKFVSAEVKRWAEVVKTSGAKLD